MGISSINAQFSTGELLLYWLKTRGEFLGRCVRSGPGPALVILPKYCRTSTICGDIHRLYDKSFWVFPIRF